MSSNSIRVSAALFEQAQRQGELMCRSTAQQVEHWARLGAALEAEGASVVAMQQLLAKGLSADAVYTEVAPENVPLGFKRERQARDLRRLEAGTATNDQMSWFSKKRARSAKVIGSPF
jgi:arginine deiminase